MNKSRNFQCTECYAVENQIVPDDVLTTKCKECGNITKRMVSAPRCFQNTTGKSPSTSNR